MALVVKERSGNNHEKAMLIVNPSSGSERSKDFEEKAASKLSEFFDAVQVYHTQGEGDATSFCKQACRERYDSVFDMGGDGTVDEAINGLAEQPYIPKFGFFPLGTVNDLARALHFSMELLEAIEEFDPNRLVDLYVGRINDHYFMNVVAIGVLPEAINDVESEDKTKLGKFAYDLSAVNNLISMETFQFRVSLDGAEENIETSTILIGLTNSIGGFETIFPEANVNDGFLNFLSIKDKNLLDTIKAVPDLLKGIDSSTQNIKYKRFKSCVIKQLDSGHTLNVNIDGDPGPELPISIQILPQHIHTYCGNKK